MTAKRRRTALVALLAALPVLAGADPARGTGEEPVVEISGAAFGTRWHVRLPAGDPAPAPAELAAEIRALLAALDARLSGWRDDSELSRFNASASTQWWAVSKDTASVVATALRVHARSQGAFDPTVAPLVALWGFGAAVPRQRPPTVPEVDAALQRVSAAALSVREDPPALRKRRGDLALDLSGVAKGFAVDAVARRLAERGVRRFLVEIGGELRSRGEGPGGGPWRVGVERPAPGPPRAEWVLALDDAALATSGDYRRGFEWQGRRYSHVLDPRSGRPIGHGLVAVSVLSREAAWADAWATALLVLGPEEGWSLARREGLAALFVVARDGRLEARATPELRRHRVD